MHFSLDLSVKPGNSLMPITNKSQITKKKNQTNKQKTKTQP